MNRTAVAVAATILLVALPVGAQSAYHGVDGVTYYFAMGTRLSGHVVNHGDAAGPHTLNFTGCAFAQFRPETGGGRMHVIGLIDDLTYLEVEFDEFLSPDGTTPAIMPNLTLDGSYGQTPTVRTSMAAWGTAVVLVDNEVLPEPVGDGERYDASFYTGHDGVRDDETLAPSTEADRGDHELHLRLRTPDDAVPTSVQGRFAPSGDLPGGLFSPNEAYSDRLVIPNLKYGGTAVFAIRMTANAPPDMNDVEFSVQSPTGQALGSVRLTPSILGAADGELRVPLSEFGMYAIEARGKVALSSYTIDITLEPADVFDLDFWWEDVEYGQEAGPAMNQCRKQMGYAIVPGSIIGRDDPPSFLLELVFVGVIAGIATVLLIVRIVSDSATSSLFRKQMGK